MIERVSLAEKRRIVIVNRKEISFKIGSLGSANWDRGRPARNEREARKEHALVLRFAPAARWRAGRPRSDQNRIEVIR